MAHCALGRQSRDAFSFESFFISPNAINHIKMNILCFSIDKGRPPMDRAVSYTEVYSSSSFLPLIKRFHKTKIILKCGNSMNHSLLMCGFFQVPLSHLSSHQYPQHARYPVPDKYKAQRWSMIENIRRWLLSINYVSEPDDFISFDLILNPNDNICLKATTSCSVWIYQR